MTAPEKRVVVWVQHFGDRPFLMLQWHDPATGKRRSKSALTCNPLDAEKARADLEYELNHGLHREPSKLTWERFRELFEEEYVAGRRPNTRRGFSATLDLFEKLCSPPRLADVTERTLSRFVAGMRKEPGRGLGAAGMKASSIKVRLQFLHTVLSWAAGQKLLPEVPKSPVIKPPKKDPQPVPAESFERLLTKADAPMRAYLLCGWLAGLRLEEAFALEWEACTDAPFLDLAHNRIVLPAGVVKAAKDQWVPLDPELRDALDALPRQGRKVFAFASEWTGKPLTGNGVSQRVRYLAKRTGVKLTFKTLRRGFGCRYAGKVPAQVLQKLMRHASIKTTMDYYANVDDAAMEAVLGAQRNAGRNSRPDEARRDATPTAATPSPETASSPLAGCTPGR